MSTPELDLLGELFPFHLRVDPAPPHRILGAGDSLLAWLADDPVGHTFGERFRITRPTDATLDPATIRSRGPEIALVQDVVGGRRLRGQLVNLADGSVALAGSPLVRTGDDLGALGIELGWFAPHDATGDPIIHSQFATVQLRDLARHQQELQAVTSDRDQSRGLAATDDLTGLANRRSFWERAEGLRADGVRLSLLYIDLDGFKQINDEHGHQVGDDVLRAMADRMRAAVRDDDLVARFGGDEFVLLVRDLPAAQLAGLAERLRQSLTRTVVTGAGEVSVSISMGVAHVTDDVHLDDVLRNADTAMYRGRAHGPGGITWFDESMGEERRDRRELTADLPAALTDGQVRPWFQPIVDLATGQIVGFEALARWHHPTRGLVRPDVFVGIAEHAGLVHDLDLAILREAARVVARMSDESGRPIQLQANVSGRSLAPRLPLALCRALEVVHLPTSQLTVEVTESWFIGDDRIDVLEEIDRSGIQLHLDDFGTGYSSLTHLQAFPIEGLKIDRSFVGQMSTSVRSRRLVAATISMARSLELDVVAEGVESADDAETLRSFGCRYAQGFHYSKPEPEAEAVELLLAWDRGEATVVGAAGD